MKVDRLSFLLLFVIFNVGTLATITVTSSTTLAQTSVKTTVPSNNSLDVTERALQAIRMQLKELNKATKKAKENNNSLAKIKIQVDELGRKITDVVSGHRNRLDEIRDRLVALGNPLEDPQHPEASIVVEERNRLISERAQMTAVLSEADVLYDSANQIANEITVQRRKLFTETLFGRTELTLSVIKDDIYALNQEAITFFI